MRLCQHRWRQSREDGNESEKTHTKSVYTRDRHDWSAESGAAVFSDASLVCRKDEVHILNR